MGQKHQQEQQETQPSAESPTEANAPLDLLSDLEERLGQLKNWQNQTDNQLREIQEESQRVKAMRDQTGELKAEVDRRQSEVDSAWEKLNQDRDQLASSQAKLEADRLGIEEELSTLDGLREEINNDRQSLGQARQEAEQEKQQIQESWEAFAQQETQLKTRLEEAASRNREMEERSSSLDEREAELANQHENLKRRDEEITQARAGFEQRQAEIDQAFSEVRQQRDQLEADLLEITQQQDQLAQERKGIQKQKIDLKLRGESLDAQQAQLEKARSELAEQAATLPEDAEARLAELRENQSQAKRLQEELDQARQELADREQSLNDREQSQGLSQEQVAELDAKKAKFKQVVADTRKQIEAEREHLRMKEQAVDQRAGEIEDFKNSYDSRKKKIRKADESLENRRGKLHRYRKLLRQRSAALQEAELRNQSSSQQFTGLEKERQMLVEVKKFLEASEGEMVRRWAATRAGSLVVGAVITVVLLAAASFFAGQQAVTPQWQATMAIAVAPAPDTTAPSDAAFVKQIETLAFSEPVMSEALNLMDRSDIGSLRIASSAQELRSHLQSHVTVGGKSGRVELSYVGEDKQVAEAALRALGQSVTQYQTVQDYEAGIEPTMRIDQSAALINSPVANGKSQQWMASGAIFAVMLSIAGGVWFFLRMMLLRSKRMFGDEQLPQLTILDKPETWSPLHAGDNA